jgi:hypothetical protein
MQLRSLPLTLIKPGSGRTVKNPGPLSFDLAFTRSKLTFPGISIVCNRALRFWEFAQNSAVPAVQLESAREQA